jgi:nucleoside-diphosphate-sugar epimerase
MTHPILVTGAAGRIGGVGGAVVEALRRRDLPVRALVRREDEHVVEVFHALDAEHLELGLPQEPAHVPARVGQVLVVQRLPDSITPTR